MEISQWNHFHCIKCICRIPKYDGRLANALEESGQSSGSAGLVVSICMLCGGIVSIVSRKNNSKGTNIALIILLGLATLTGFVLAGNYSDLYMVFLVFDQYNTRNYLIKKRYQKLKLIPFKL